MKKSQNTTGQNITLCVPIKFEIFVFYFFFKNRVISGRKNRFPTLRISLNLISELSWPFRPPPPPGVIYCNFWLFVAFNTEIEENAKYCLFNAHIWHSSIKIATCIHVWFKRVLDTKFDRIENLIQKSGLNLGHVFF